MSTWIDAVGQERCDDIKDLTLEQLHCGAGLAGTRHLFDQGMKSDRNNSNFPNSSTVVQRCGCGRWRRRTVSNKTHEVLVVAYGGGVILTGEYTSKDVFWAYLRACMERERKTLQSVK